MQLWNATWLLRLSFSILKRRHWQCRVLRTVGPRGIEDLNRVIPIENSLDSRRLLPRQLDANYTVARGTRVLKTPPTLHPNIIYKYTAESPATQ